MSEYRLRKQVILEAEMIVDARDGLAAALKLHEWKPTQWTMRDGDWSSEPHVREPETPYEAWAQGCTRPVYEVRACRGHFHVMCCGEDLMIPGDPFPTREAADEAMRHLSSPAPERPV